MAKLILKFNDEVLDQIELKQGDMTIGRKPGNDILIDNLAVSGNHASIFTVGEESFIQDLNSTNGTFINSKRIAKHRLAHGDTIVIGKHSLTYMSNQATKADNFAKTVIINPKPPEKNTQRQAALFILSGPNSGKRVDISKPVTHLGSTGKPAGVVTETTKGYMLSAVPGGETPKLNSKPVSASGEELKNGDIIEVADTRVQFYLK